MDGRSVQLFEKLHHVFLLVGRETWTSL